MDNTSSSKKENFFLKLLYKIVKRTYKKNEIWPKFVGTLCTLFITGIYFKCGKNVYELYVRHIPVPIFLSILFGYMILSIKTWIKTHNENYISKCKEEEEMVIADQLKDILQKNRETLGGNFDPRDPKFVSFKEELERLFKKKNLEITSFSQLFVTYCINYPLVLFFSYLSLWYLLPAFKSSSSLKLLHFVILGLIIGYLTDGIWNKRNNL